MIRQPRRFAAIVNSRPSSPEPNSIKVAMNMNAGDSRAANAPLDRPQARGFLKKDAFIVPRHRCRLAGRRRAFEEAPDADGCRRGRARERMEDDSRRRP